MRDGVTNVSIHRIGDGDHHRQHDCGGTVGYVEEEVMEELKPCPFCGEPVHLWKVEHPRLYRPVRNHPYCVVCNGCDLLFGFDEDYGGIFDTEEEAIEAWNRRAG